MARNIRILVLIGLLVIASSVAGVVWWRASGKTPSPAEKIGAMIELPAPRYESSVSLEAALLQRRSVRDYSVEPLTLTEAGQLLWAAQGITDARGGRTVPSAGALYPLEVFLLAGSLDGLPAGVYRYLPHEHALAMVQEGDRRIELYQAALNQEAVKDGAIVIVFAAVYERTQVKYGERGAQYVHIEVGCAAQNVYLQAAALDLGTVFIGAFYDDQVKAVLGLEENEVPLGLMPVGRR